MTLVSLERVLAPGARAAFWLTDEVTIGVPWFADSQRFWRDSDDVGRSCLDAPLLGLHEVRVTMPREVVSGARFLIEFGNGYDVVHCDDVPARLRSAEGEPMRAIGDGRIREWIVPRNTPRFILALGLEGKTVDVPVDLVEKKLLVTPPKLPRSPFGRYTGPLY